MLKFDFIKPRFLAAPLAPILLSMAPASESAQAGDQPLLSLLDMTLERLQIARQVALSKWDSGQPVKDLPRETEVIRAAAEEARAAGVSTQLATHFFADQMEANKLVQYALLSDWFRAAKAPNEKRLDLRQDIRPELDRLQRGFIKALADTETLRSRDDCRAQLARAMSSYVSQRALTPLYAVAMERALARACDQA
ncbi:chorismate mutase [Paraburkholderia tropica]|uniref:chorismate mutase n=1 Tax=Paraburkholderia tropica TaxID=92647 RepID=UPI0007EE1E08|nr:chorismate mutase [Paraburkholderia tropica]OBR49206.1 hypothetical protein A6456_36125 [Paraburkholderia tropica]